MAWTSKDSKKTNCILSLEHINAMMDAMEEVPRIDIVLDMCPDNSSVLQSVVATITNKAGTKTKEIFRALIGTSGKYLARYDTALFTRVS